MSETLKETTDDSREHFQDAWDHARAAGHSLRKSLREMLPSGFVEHQSAARKELLLAFRSLVDAAIERSEKRSSS